ncbi:MAG: putative DNA binding domain-containing protein [archaeon]|nr:putative DNA binding domain-containing protein [archaeon]
MKEDEKTEFKKELTETIAKAAVAFSNTEGGRILVGIDDSGAVQELDDPDATSRGCAQILKNSVRPDITMTSKIEHLNIEGKDVICIDVKEGYEKPYYLREKGLRAEGVFVRRGTSNQPLSESEFRLMIQNIRSRSYETTTSLDQELTFETTSRIFKEHGVGFEENHRKLLGLINGEGYTNLAYMLSDQFRPSVKIAVYVDESKTAFTSRQIFNGSVLGQLLDALDFIEKNNRLSSEIIGYKRHDSWQFPPVAVREAVLNAIIHRNYAIEGSILVCIYPDKLCITSPGSLNECYSVEDLKIGVSSSRNPLLADIFYRLGYCETYGSGIPRIIDCYRDLEQPEIIVGDSVFHVCLPATDKKSVDPLEQMLKSKEVITRADVEQTGHSKTEALSIIDSLMKAGKLVKYGGGRSTKYIVQ